MAKKMRSRHDDFQDATKGKIEIKEQKLLMEEKKEGFGDYFNYLMRTSLITGFPVMAITKNPVRRVVKLLAFFICTVGFLYQTLYILHVYFSYPTEVKSVTMETGSIIAPAVTICNRNRFYRTLYCSAFPHHCVTRAKTKEEFCEKFPKYCHFHDNSTESFQIGLLAYFEDPNRSNEVLNKMGLQDIGHLIDSCFIIEGRLETICKNYMMIQASRNGYPNKCVTVDSMWGKPTELLRNVSHNGGYSLTLKIMPEEYFYYFDGYQVYVYLHDPRTLANPMSKGIALDAGYIYNLYVTMERRESLPAPYSTDCTDYESLWLENGGTGPMSKEDCIQICKMKSVLNDFRCVSQSITCPNDFEICENRDTKPTDEAISDCMQDCKEACAMNVYTFKYEAETSFGQLLCGNNITEYCRNAGLRIKIRFNEMSVRTYKHEGKFRIYELLGHIGGYTGLWLGISMLSLFSFAEMIFDILTYPLIKYCKAGKMQTRTAENR